MSEPEEAAANAGDKPRRLPDSQRSGDAAGCGGSLWIIGWLFTIGFSELSVGKAILAVVIWPYYLGETLRIALS